MNKEKVLCNVCRKEVPETPELIDGYSFTKYGDIDVCGFECSMTMAIGNEGERRIRAREEESGSQGE